ncbi:uncharacterized protein DFL_007898 [Arthrobotrys flagrans]|uniref:BTB domain-containing protein n=1 Tax=Arthrobotrys flagrans TaxID=97331 RepID=A0A436ZXJ3_ARTFL|nr:hypothetical protein DFL_007898 [Arthrobotrys flagrans]
MSATDSSSSANAENNANFDHAGSSARTLEAIPSRTPSVSEADVEVNTVGEAAANLSILEAGCEGIEHERISIQVVTKWESDFVLYAHSNERTVDYAVTRDVLRVTSPVLRQLIEQNSEQYPTHSDENGGCCDICGRRKGHSTLHLEEDDLEAFLSLLEIVHSRASHHLLDPDFDLVTRIAVACEKYGWQKAILPWKQIWIKKYLKHILEPGYEDWLRVAKIFEIEEKTTGLVDLLCEECSCLVRDAESGRNFVKRKGKPVFTDLWPQEILGEYFQRDISYK